MTLIPVRGRGVAPLTLSLVTILQAECAEVDGFLSGRQYGK
jgi:hypothetical protein